MPEIEHLSYSSISLYLECPRKFWFRHVQGLPAATTASLAFGRAFHATVARALVAGGQELTTIWTEEWQRATQDVEIAWDGTLPEELENDGFRLFGEECVRQTLQRIIPYVDEMGPFVERRIELHVPGVPVPVIGYVDLLAADGVITDHKTTARKWSDQDAQYEAQPLFYLAALNQLGVPHQAGRFRHVVFVRSRTPQVQVFETVHEASEVLWLLETIRGVWRCIAAELYPPNPRACWAWGRRCEYWEVCRGRL